MEMAAAWWVALPLARLVFAAVLALLRAGKRGSGASFSFLLRTFSGRGGRRIVLLFRRVEGNWGTF